MIRYNLGEIIIINGICYKIVGLEEYSKGKYELSIRKLEDL